MTSHLQMQQQQQRAELFGERRVSERASVDARVDHCVGVLHESHELGAHSLDALARQRESLQRSEAALDRTDVLLSRGERLERSLSFWGRVRNLFSRPSVRPWQPLRAHSRKSARNSGPGVSGDARDSDAGDQSHSEPHPLDRLDAPLASLKALAAELGGELDAHGELLDRTAAKAERADARTRQLNYKINKRL